MCRFSLAVLCSLILLLATSTADAAPADLSGMYRCQGTSDQGTPYSGVVEIKQVRKGYQLTWTVDKTKYAGIGFIHDGYLSVAWTVKTVNGTAIGVLLYKVKEDGTLEGKWTDPSLNGVYDETLTPIKGDRTI
ncbi:hypothetical protein AB1L30_21715 [Bremerella sp. JC817]|uniref:hypothetical protein n=1 Tax=Bremerella sp. JC817 TaxID=3231756 RepID=UPI00345AF7FD